MRLGNGNTITYAGINFFMDFTNCICERCLSLFFVQVCDSPLGRQLAEHHFDRNSCGEGQHCSNPLPPVRGLGALGATPAGFGEEPKPNPSRPAGPQLLLGGHSSVHAAGRPAGHGDIAALRVSCSVNHSSELVSHWREFQLNSAVVMPRPGGIKR